VKLGWRPWLAGLPVLLIFGPLLPGLYWALIPAVDAAVWQALWRDGQWPQALRATLISAVLGTVLACGLATLLATLHYPGRLWWTLQRRLPLLLSLPHAAFAVGLFFLLAPSGWLARALAQGLGWTSPPEWITVQDPYGLSLALALAVKESWFLLWVLASVLGEQAVSRQMAVARSMGYSRFQTWQLILWPLLLPRLVWPMVAVFAYGLSVVDMAIILGPGTPPTLAVLIWHWLTDPDPALQARGIPRATACFRGGRPDAAWALVAAAAVPALPHRPAQTRRRLALAQAAHSSGSDGLCGGGRVVALVAGPVLVFSGAVAASPLAAELATGQLGAFLDHALAGHGRQFAVFACGFDLVGVGATTLEYAVVSAADRARFAAGGRAVRGLAAFAAGWQRSGTGLESSALGPALYGDDADWTLSCV
jgi:ABC-type sulfate transport system permease component